MRASSTMLKRLPQARHTMQVTSAKTGYLASMQCEQIGTACVILGGGRERKEDSVDPAVGIVLHKKVGDRVAAGEATRDDLLQCGSASGAGPAIDRGELRGSGSCAADETAAHPQSDRKVRGEKLNGTISREFLAC